MIVTLDGALGCLPQILIPDVIFLCSAELELSSSPN